jgi:hypothetical protein
MGYITRVEGYIPGAAGRESVRAVFLFLTSLDEANGSK